jgi:UDP-N-acetylmuramoyl-tripeptide--D-alanyl-D-alanine ligase
MSDIDPRFAPPATFTGHDLVALTGGTHLAGPLDGEWTVCTDSRLISDGAVFIALVGDTFDGHRFAAGVVEANVAGVLVQSGELTPESRAALEQAKGPVIAVEDTLVALGNLARGHMLRHRPEVVGITGSVGKTTTRAMTAAILRRMAPGLESQGNFNNRIGLPLTVLHLQPEHRWMVLEMGMSEAGEIAALADIVRPGVRVITEVTPAHLEFFDGVEQIADAKGELFRDAQPEDVLIFPSDNPLSVRFPMPAHAQRVPFSVDPHSTAPVRPMTVRDRGLEGTEATIRLFDDVVEVRINLPGAHQLHNALAAAAAARALGASAEDIAEGLACVEVPGRRMRREHRAGLLVLDDAYNASPASMAAALRTLAAIDPPNEAGRRVAALGDMLELGETAPELHADVGRLAAELGLDYFVGAGPLMNHAVDAAREAGLPAQHAEDSKEAGELLRAILRVGDVLLLKGSRGMSMERVLDSLPPPTEPPPE